MQVHGIFHKNINGSSRQVIIRSCRNGELLRLVAEPDNLYDPGAVKVCRTNGDQLGYLPAEHAFRIAQDLAGGARFRVTVDDVSEFDDNPGKFGCRVRLAVLAD